MPKKEEHSGSFSIDEKDLQDENDSQQDDITAKAKFTLLEGGLEGWLEVLQVEYALQTLGTKCTPLGARS